MTYTFIGPFYHKAFGKTIVEYGIQGDQNHEFILEIASGHLNYSSSVTKELGEIQKVLNGQKTKHVLVEVQH